MTGPSPLFGVASPPALPALPGSLMAPCPPGDPERSRGSSPELSAEPHGGGAVTECWLHLASSASKGNLRPLPDLANSSRDASGALCHPGCLRCPSPAVPGMGNCPGTRLPPIAPSTSSLYIQPKSTLFQFKITTLSLGLRKSFTPSLFHKICKVFSRLDLSKLP